jgi:hypothetical protein
MLITNTNGDQIGVDNISLLRPKEYTNGGLSVRVYPPCEGYLITTEGEQVEDTITEVEVFITPAELLRMITVAPHLFTSPDRAREIAVRSEQVENGPNC